MACALVSRRAAAAQAPGTSTGAPTPEVVDRSLSQPTDAGEIDLLTEAGSAEAGWPMGSGSVESANKLVVEARLKGAGMRWGRHNVNPMLVLRNAVCKRRWQETWTTARAQRHAVRTKLRHAQSQQRLDSACWFLVFWGVRVYRLSHPSGAAATATTAQALAEHPTPRPGSGYSWRKPFLRRLPSTPMAPVEASAK
ncbi:MAG TPA: hypothetical protein VIY29_16310 [Ktedonobacteraceae bacterium]